MRHVLIMVALTFFVTGFMIQETSAQGSVIRKLKEKAEDKVIDKVFEPVSVPKVETPPSQDSEVNSGANRPSNTRGGGLTKSAPDVSANIKEAEIAFNDKKFNDSRFAVRQAIQGVELEIGKNILEGLPESISNLPKVDEEDLVTSSGIGFVGLVIQRYYRKGDQELSVMIGNDSGLLAAANMYLMAGAYSTSSTDPAHKTVKVKEYRGLLEYDEYSGYKLTVPFGQTSVLVVEGINFDDEKAIMAAAEMIDIDKIKKELGEQ